jgi:hypothetical protein
MLCSMVLKPKPTHGSPLMATKVEKFNAIASAMEQQLKARPHLSLAEIEQPFKDGLKMGYQTLKTWMKKHGSAYPTLFRSYIRGHGNHLPMELKEYEYMLKG